MKRYITCVLAVISALVLLCSCSGRKAKNEGYRLYRSSPVGLEIEYPDFWEVSDDKEDRTVCFVTPNVGYADDYRDNVSIVVEETGSEDMAFDKYVTDYINALPSAINNFNKITENELEVAGLESYRIVYEGTAEDGDLRLEQIFIKSGNYTFVYSLIAEPDSFDYFAKNSEVMLSTFKPLRK